MITGTFIDEITHDIPSQNWGPVEWARDFAHMRECGIDTVILIRAGYRHLCTFASRVLQDSVGIFPVHEDLLQLFLDESARNGLRFFFGLYDSGKHWVEGDYRQEIDLNKAFCDEVIESYGQHPAFAGWYASHELHSYDKGLVELYAELSRHLRSLKDVPVLMSPYVKGEKQFGHEAITFDGHADNWRRILDTLAPHIDILAFQDGQMSFRDLPRYQVLHQELARMYGIRSWSNIESFDRDMPIKFPPIDFRKLQYKLESAMRAGFEKLITFEFSHFMSPQSAYPAAHHLNHRYQQWMRERT